MGLQVRRFSIHIPDTVRSQVGTFGSDDGAGGLIFAGAAVAQDDDIARREDRGEDLLDVERVSPLIGSSITEGGRSAIDPGDPAATARQGVSIAAGGM
jgi:hypothetical protein